MVGLVVSVKEDSADERQRHQEGGGGQYIARRVEEKGGFDQEYLQKR